MSTLRFATVGTSGITGQFLDALADVGDVEYVAAYSRDVGKARAFGEPRGARRFFGDLSELAACDEVDAVYVASPNALHAPQAKRLIEAGKHVLVEKSFASNEREAKEVFDRAREQGVVAMEAMRNIHVNTFGAIRDQLGRLGQVRLVDIGFSKVTSRMARFLAGERVNIFDPRLAAGALMDIGVYCVAPAVALFGRPETIKAVGVTSAVPGAEEGDPCRSIDLSGIVVLGYADKAVSLTYGKVSDDQLSCQVQGEKGTLVWDQASCPENLRYFAHEDKGMVYRVEKPEGERIDVAPPARDMACEIRDFRDAVAGALDAGFFEQATLDGLHVMDEARRQMGVVFPADL